MAGSGGSRECSDDLTGSEPSTKRPKTISIITALQRTPSESQKVSCPACGLEVHMKSINRHLDAECRGMERSSYLCSTLERQDKSKKSEGPREELSIRFTERLDPEIPCGNLKGLVTNRRAGRSVKSSRDRWHRSSYSLEDEAGVVSQSDQSAVAVETDTVDVRKPSENLPSGDTISTISDSATSAPQLESTSNQLPYYLANFMMILDTVLFSEDRVLLNDEDLNVVDTFQQLSGKASVTTMTLTFRTDCFLCF